MHQVGNKYSDIAEQLCVNYLAMSIKTQETGSKSFKKKWKILAKQSNNHMLYQSLLVWNDCEQKIN